MLVGDFHLSIDVEGESVLGEFRMSLFHVLSQLLSRFEIFKAGVNRTVDLLCLTVQLHLFSSDWSQLLYFLLFLNLLKVFLRALEVAEFLQGNCFQRKYFLVLILELDYYLVFLHVLKNLVFQLIEFKWFVVGQNCFKLEVVLFLVQLLEHLVVQDVDLFPVDSFFALVVLVYFQVEGFDKKVEFFLIDLQTHLFVVRNDDEYLGALDIWLFDVVHFNLQLLLELVEEHVYVVMLFELVLKTFKWTYLEHLAGEKPLREVLVCFQEHVFSRHLGLLERCFLKDLVFEFLIEVFQVVVFFLANEIAHIL